MTERAARAGVEAGMRAYGGARGVPDPAGRRARGQDLPDACVVFAGAAAGPPRRHDLVWLADQAAGACAVAAPDRAALEAWVARRLPLVVGRQDGQPGGLRLGFTLPGLGPRRRVGVRAPAELVRARRAPPRLALIAVAAPAAWRAPLEQLACALADAGVEARCYGSLVSQAYTGMACLRPDSDIDLILDCTNRAAALRALVVLARHGDGVPRIDGEIRMPDGRAAAWRELAWAHAAGGRVLAKSDDAVGLVAVHDFLSARRMPAAAEIRATAALGGWAHV